MSILILIKGDRGEYTLKFVLGLIRLISILEGVELALKFRFTLSQTTSHANSLYTRNCPAIHNSIYIYIPIEQTSIVGSTPDKKQKKGISISLKMSKLFAALLF